MTEQNIQKFLKAKRNLFDKHYHFLNPEQREAVYTVNGPLLILAGAGSGKTTVLVNRIGHIIKYGDGYYSNEVPDFITEDSLTDLEEAAKLPDEQIVKYLEMFAKNPCKPWGVLAFTFTNKAANEIVSRLGNILKEDASEIWTGTFHKVCMRILRKHYELLGYRANFSVCDMDDAKKVISQAMKDLNLDEKILPIKTVMNEIGRAKDKLMTPEDYALEVGTDVKYRNIASIYNLYQKRLKESNLLDFDDIIMKTVELLQQNEEVRSYYQSLFKYVLVDEYQDTNKAQFVLVSLLSGYYKNVMVVGDDDQSIYKFRGATIENILNFDNMYPNAKIVKLEQNYRSTSNILNAANDVISNNQHKHIKKLWCANEPGEKILVKQVPTQNDESRYIIDSIVKLKSEQKFNYKDFAVLYRMNAQSMNLETMFAKSGIPYRVFGAQRFYDRKEVKDIVSYLSVLNNPDDSVRLRRIVNEPKRKIGDASFDAATKIAEELGISTMKVLENATSYNAIPKIAANSMVEFAKMMNSLKDEINDTPPHQFVKNVIKRTGYEMMLIALGQSEADRLENLDALCDAAREYEENADEPTLGGFLEEVALVSDIDKYDEGADAVTLMTIHSSKGMEFPVVFLPGMEEGIFPGQQSITAPGEIEEERRLAYVAITRAKKILRVIYAKERMLYGQTQHNPLSRFIKEIDEKYLDIQKENPFAFSRTAQSTYEPQASTIFSSISSKKTEKKDIKVYSIGTRVHHCTFGDGTILNVTPMSSDYMYEIAFDNIGTKKLMATYTSKIMKEI